MLYELGISHQSKVGLLGGSFNPPHYGHVHVSEMALQMLGLDYVVWLLSPQNPMKPKDELRSFDIRLQICEKMVSNHKEILVSDFERDAIVDDNLTCSTLSRLQELYPHTSFAWIMGADNLEHFYKWGGWNEIVSIMPVVVFNRNEFLADYKPSGTSRAGEAGFSSADAGSYYGVPLVWVGEDAEVKVLSPNHIYLLPTQNIDISSTEIRNKHMLFNENQLSDQNFTDTLKNFLLHSLEDDNGRDISVIDLSGKTDFASYMIVVSGNSSRHIKSIASNLKTKLKNEMGVLSNVSSGDSWIVVDTLDIIVHLFKPHEREKYSLEKMWDAQFDE